MNWTPEEAAKLLANRINQPHYIEWAISKVVRHEMSRLARGRQPSKTEDMRSLRELEDELDLAEANDAIREADEIGTVSWESAKEDLIGRRIGRRELWRRGIKRHGRFKWWCGIISAPVWMPVYCLAQWLRGKVR